MLPALAIPYIGTAGNAVVGLVAPVAAYLGYEYLTGDNSPPFLGTDVPKGKDIIPLPVRPTLTTPLKPAIDDHNKSVNDTKNNIASAKSSLVSDISARNAYNSDLKSSFVDSPLLGNQIELKNTLDEISFALNGQSAVYAMVFETLDRNLALLNSSILTIAQNNKVITDMQTTIAKNSDYGDEDYFYAFKPSDQYWSEADRATVLHDEQSGVSTNLHLLPSRLYLTGELRLIERMEKNSSRRDIRTAVENYRRSELSEDIRALMGVALVQSTTNDKENTKVQTDYFKTAVEALKSNDSVKALNNLVSALAPVSQWADKAKVRESFLTTPIPQVKDLDGETVASNVSPMEISLAKDVAIAREKADIINETFDDTDNPLSSFDLMPLLNFVGRGDTFDVSKTLSNVFKPDGV